MSKLKVGKSYWPIAVFVGGLRVCTYCNKIFQTYTQSPDMMSNLEQLQADIRAVAMDTEHSGIPHSASVTSLSLPRSGHSYDEDHDKILRKTSTASSNSAVFEKLEQMEARQTIALQSTRSPFDAFGVCAAEANILKQVIWAINSIAKNLVALFVHSTTVGNQGFQK